MARTTLADLRAMQERVAHGDSDAPVTINQAVGELPTKTQPCDLGLAARLERRFGLGDDRRRRMVLYRRLETLFLQHGQIVWSLCAEAAAQAVGTDSPGRYFSRAIVAKLRDHKILPAVEGGDL